MKVMIRVATGVCVAVLCGGFGFAWADAGTQVPSAPTESAAIGALVDRWSRRVTMIVADGAVALGSLVLAGLFLTGRASIGVVLLFVLGRAIPVRWAVQLLEPLVRLRGDRQGPGDRPGGLLGASHRGHPQLVDPIQLGEAVGDAESLLVAERSQIRIVPGQPPRRPIGLSVTDQHQVHGAKVLPGASPQPGRSSYHGADA